MSQTAPKIAVTTPGVAVEGYWLDDNRYFYLDESMESSIDRAMVTPSIFDCERNSAREVVSLARLAEAISAASGERIDLRALSSAEFDMPDPGTLAVSVSGHDYLFDTGAQRVVKSAISSGIAALYSPDGKQACFVNGHDLWLKDRVTGAERPLTTDGTRHHCYGQPSEMGLSVLSYRRRPYPMGLWSPDSQWLLIHRIDDRPLPELALVQHAPPGGRPLLHRYKYSMPGDPAPVATYLAIHVASGKIVTFDDFPAPVVTPYAPFSRTAWFGAADRAWFVRPDRYWKHVDLICLDLTKGTGRIALNESTAAGYIDLHPMRSGQPNVRVLQSGEVLWYSERDGWGHLYLYDAATGKLRNRVTRGEWVVRDIVHVDEERRRLLFLAGGVVPKSDPARRSLCAVNFDGSGFEILLSHAGDIFLPRSEPFGLDQGRPFRPQDARGGVSPTGRFAAVRYASVDRGNRTEIVDLCTQRGVIIAAARPADHEVRPRHFSVVAADGATPLHGVMFFPSDFNEHRRYPLIDYLYPGPQSPQQPQSFRSVNSAQARALAELGFVTIMLDTRGMPVGSKAFHQAGYPELLEPQLSDHAAAVRQLCERYRFLDGDRIGLIGYSGGGFATARALCDYGELFKVGVAVCGNHDSNFYSTVWSDKYRGGGDPAAWSHQATHAVAHKLRGKLLLISGDMDENVHVGHTLSLVDAFIRANRDFDLLIVPNEGHYVLLTNGYVQRRVWDYFVRHLLGRNPPSSFEVKFEPHEVACFEKRLIREIRQ